VKWLRILLPLVGLAIVVGSSSFFIVPEGRQALVTQFGRPVAGPYKQAGLYFKLPFIQQVHMFEKRLLKWDGKPNQIPTRDKKYIWVDTTARWRIVDPLKFLKTVGTEEAALSRLDDIIDSVVRDMVSSNLLVELVRSADWKPAPPTPEAAAMAKLEPAKHVQVKKGRAVITREMLKAAAALTPRYGIELVDIQIKRINYVKQVQRRVFERMISERKRIASQYRSEGEGEKRRILGKMERELARIRSEAYRKAQQIRGLADAQATAIYAQAFGQDPRFFAFWRTLTAYKRLPKGKLELLLTTDSQLLRYIRSMPSHLDSPKSRP